MAGKSLLVLTPHPAEDAIRQAFATASSLEIAARPTAADIANASRVAVIAGEPGAAIRWAIHRYGLSEQEALLFVAESFAAAATAARRTDVQMLSPDAFQRDLQGELENLRRLLQLPAGATPPAPEIAGPGAGRQDDEIERALDIYRTLPLTRGASAQWDRVVFRLGDAPAEPCSAEIDITGPARILVFGPYIALPAGRWRATLRFELCEDAARKTFFFQFGDASNLAEASLRPSHLSPQTVVLETELSAPAPVEIRVSVLRAAFHGAFRWDGALVEQL